MSIAIVYKPLTDNHFLDYLSKRLNDFNLRPILKAVPSRAGKTGVLGTARHGQSSALVYKGCGVKNFLRVNFKDCSCKEQQTALMASNITAE